MKKLDYLKLFFQHRLFTKKAMLITMFSVTRTDSGNQSPYLYKLVPQPWGYSYYDEKMELQKIDDSVANQPLFTFKDRINIDPSWIENLSEAIETSVGNLLFNHFCVVTGFGSKFPYVQGRTSVSKLEDKIAERLRDTPATDAERSTEYFYCDEYLRFVDALEDFKSLSQLAAWSATRKAVLPPKGLDAFKKELLAKYKGKLDDPVEIAKFEKELLAFDAEYLKDDPAFGTFLSGKITNTARKKLFLTMGNEQGFGDPLRANPVTNSLHEGWPTDAKQFTAMMNGLRVGSFARGSETIKGGVSAKYLLRAANNFKIDDTDCGTQFGIPRVYNHDNAEQLAKRSVIENGRSVLVENAEQAGNYLGKQLRVRSPMYCKLPGDVICKVCAGNRLAQYPTGLTIPLTEISAMILAASMKSMHTSGTSTAKLDIQKSIS